MSQELMIKINICTQVHVDKFQLVVSLNSNQISFLLSSRRGSCRYSYYIVGGKMSQRNLEHQINTNFFLWRLIKMLTLLKWFIVNMLCRNQLFLSGWDRWFKKGWEDMHDDARSEQPKIQKKQCLLRLRFSVTDSRRIEYK